MRGTSISKGILYAFGSSFATLILIVLVTSNDSELLLSWLAIFAMIGGPIIAFCLVVIGIPVFLLLERFKLRRWWHYILPSTFPGIVFIWLFKPFGNDPFSDLLVQTCFCATIGAIAAFTFWLVTIKPRLKDYSN